MTPKIFLKLKKLSTLLSIIPKLKIRTLYSLLLKSNEPTPIIARFDNEHGSFTGLANDYLFQSAKEQGINEKHFEELARLIIKPDWNVIDLGANIGTHSILLSKLASGGRVFSFEPQSLTFSLLQNNLLLNSCKNVFPYRFAISNTEMDVMFMESFTYQGENINNGALQVSQDNFSGDMTISKKLDDFNLPPISFIKMDIQGFEVNALRGAKETIMRHKPIMFVEIEEQRLRSFKSSSKELIELLLGYGYTLFRVMTDYPCDHICVPKEKVGEFVLSVLEEFSYKVEKIEGEKVNLFFNRAKDQNYERIEIDE